MNLDFLGWEAMGLTGGNAEEVLQNNPFKDSLMSYATEISTLNDAFDRRRIELDNARLAERDELNAKAAELDAKAAALFAKYLVDQSVEGELLKAQKEEAAFLQLMPIREIELKIAICDELHPLWKQLIVNKAFATKRIYESLMQPLLEEYWLKLNAMLGYVSVERYEYSALYVINTQALVNPLSMVDYDWAGVNEYLIEANNLRRQLEQALVEIEARREAEVKAEILQAVIEQQERDVKQKEVWGDDVFITLPLLPGMAYVKFGMEGSKLVAGYGGLGTEILQAWDPATGVTSETVTHSSSVILEGFPDLLISGKNNLETLRNSMTGGTLSGVGRVSGSKLLANIPSVKGQIPSFDVTKGEGRTTTFDRDGEVIDVTTFTNQSGSIYLGFWGVSRSKAVYSHNGLVTSRVERRIDVSFGPLSGRVK
jgi:hypothetical protein